VNQLTPQAKTFSLDVNGLNIAGIRHTRKGNTVKALCLHGWLDNANSFVPMMPYLPSIDLVAIDMPGHGHSDHSVSGYTLHEYTHWVQLILDALDWQECHIIGHSLGGCIAAMVSAGCPERIQKLALIEASGPMSEEAEGFPDRLKRYLQERRSSHHLAGSRLFTEKEQAGQSRLKAARMDTASASLIIDRQLQSSNDGYRWRFDPLLRSSSAQYQTEAQVQAILNAIECPALTVIAETGFLNNRPQTSERLSSLKNNTVVHLSGHHHVHMDSPEPVAAAINRFFDTVPALGG